LLGIVLLAGCGYIEVNLASLEPFDAFSFRVAGWLTISVALIGFTASFFVPMAYCRFGCPTGAVLNFLRFNKRSDKVQPRDCLAVIMLVIAFVITV